MLRKHSEAFMHILSQRRFERLPAFRTGVALHFEQSVPYRGLVNEISVNGRQL